MKIFNAVVIRTDEYEIEVDENIWDEEYLEEWSNIFHRADIEGIVKHLSWSLQRFGSGSFIEGFGKVKTFYKNGQELIQLQEEEKYCEGITVRIISEDEDFDNEIELKEMEK